MLFFDETGNTNTNILIRKKVEEIFLILELIRDIFPYYFSLLLLKFNNIIVISNT